MLLAMSRAEKDQLSTAVSGSTWPLSWGSTCYSELGFVHRLFDFRLHLVFLSSLRHVSFGFAGGCHGAKVSGQSARQHNPRKMRLLLLPARLVVTEQGLQSLHCQRLSNKFDGKPTARIFSNELASKTWAKMVCKRETVDRAIRPIALGFATPQAFYEPQSLHHAL